MTPWTRGIERIRGLGWDGLDRLDPTSRNSPAVSFSVKTGVGLQPVGVVRPGRLPLLAIITKRAEDPPLAGEVCLRKQGLATLKNVEIRAAADGDAAPEVDGPPPASEC